MELTEREWDVVRRAVWKYAGMDDRHGDGIMDHSDWCRDHHANENAQSIARDLYFRFSHELV